MFHFHKVTDNHPVVAKRRHMTLGEKAADWMTKWMGSWVFLIAFLIFCSFWVALMGAHLGWDPYPFILLNLALSLVSALQAPIIMMSQNRQAERDRIAAKYDYAVNRKAEREIQDMQQDLEEIKRLIKKHCAGKK